MHGCHPGICVQGLIPRFRQERIRSAGLPCVDLFCQPAALRPRGRPGERVFHPPVLLLSIRSRSATHARPPTETTRSASREKPQPATATASPKTRRSRTSACLWKNCAMHYQAAVVVLVVTRGAGRCGAPPS